MINAKGISRQYRKALSRNGYKGFPLKGAFYVTCEDKRISASDIEPGLDLTYVDGEIPVNPDHMKLLKK